MSTKIDFEYKIIYDRRYSPKIELNDRFNVKDHVLRLKLNKFQIKIYF